VFIIFSLEFVSYFLDRNLRLIELKKQLKHFTEQNNILHDKQKIVQEKYDQVIQYYFITYLHKVIQYILPISIIVLTCFAMSHICRLVLVL